MPNKNRCNESEIATAGAHVLQQRFIDVAVNERVLYVKNDTLFSRAPNENPVKIKRLTGRDQKLSRTFNLHKSFIIKKRVLERTE